MNKTILTYKVPIQVLDSLNLKFPNNNNNDIFCLSKSSSNKRHCSASRGGGRPPLITHNQKVRSKSKHNASFDLI